MRTSLRVLIPLAAAAAAVPMALAPGVANAQGNSSYQATLNPLNHSTGSGMLSLTLSGNSATISENWTGLAPSFGGAPYPHVQHIHGDANGVCPTMSADKNGDGIVDTVEGQPSYGPILTTLSVKGSTSAKAGTNIKIAPSGPSTNYHRTIQLNSQTVKSIQAGTAVIVVHGLDPTTLSKKAQGEKSHLVPSLPLAATSPALCGKLTAMPTGGVSTGTGTPGTSDQGLIGLGAGLLLLGSGTAVAASRRRNRVGAKA